MIIESARRRKGRERIQRDVGQRRQEQLEAEERQKTQRQQQIAVVGDAFGAGQHRPEDIGFGEGRQENLGEGVAQASVAFEVCQAAGRLKRRADDGQRDDRPANADHNEQQPKAASGRLEEAQPRSPPGGRGGWRLRFYSWMCCVLAGRLWKKIAYTPSMATLRPICSLHIIVSTAQTSAVRYFSCSSSHKAQTRKAVASVTG